MCSKGFGNKLSKASKSDDTDCEWSGTEGLKFFFTDCGEEAGEGCFFCFEVLDFTSGWLDHVTVSVTVVRVIFGG